MWRRLLTWLQQPTPWPSADFDPERLNSIGRMIGGRLTSLDDGKDSPIKRRWREGGRVAQRRPLARWKLILVFAGIYGAAILIAVLLIIFLPVHAHH